MSRPVFSPTTASSTGWVAILNSNFGIAFDAPMPLALYADATALNTGEDATLLHSCLAVVGTPNARIYLSNGTLFSEYRPEIALIADLNPATAVLGDVLTAYNTLLAELQAGGWMA